MHEIKLKELRRYCGFEPSGDLEALQEFYHEELLREPEPEPREEPDPKREENEDIVKYYERHPEMVPAEHANDYYCWRCGHWHSKKSLKMEMNLDPRILEMRRMYPELEEEET